MNKMKKKNQQEATGILFFLFFLPFFFIYLAFLVGVLKHLKIQFVVIWLSFQDAWGLASNSNLDLGPDSRKGTKD